MAQYRCYSRICRLLDSCFESDSLWQPFHIYIKYSRSYYKLQSSLVKGSYAKNMLQAAISIAVLGVFLLPFVRYYVYKLFLYTYIALTVIVIVAIFLYLAPFDFLQLSIILLIIVGALYAILIATRIGISLQNRIEVRIFEENGLLKADITLAKPRQVRAGQYVFLRVPSISALSINKLHPFFIALWDQDKGNKTRNITALI